MSLDKDTIEVFKIALEAMEELDKKLQALQENCHHPYMSAEIVFRYEGVGDTGEWFAAGFWSGDWPEIIMGDERAEQLAKRARNAK